MRYWAVELCVHSAPSWLCAMMISEISELEVEVANDVCVFVFKARCCLESSAINVVMKV